MSTYLKLSTAINKGDFKKVELYAEELEIPMHIVMKFYEETNEWVKDSFDK